MLNCLRVPLAACVLTLMFGAATVASTSPSTTNDAIAERLAGADHRVHIAGVNLSLHPDLRAFYGARDYRQVWTPALVEALIHEIRESANDGLDPAEYHLDDLESQLAAHHVGSALSTDLDVLSTDAFLRLAQHLLRGRLDPHEIYGNDWIPTRRDRDLRQLLNHALEMGDIAGTLEQVRPAHPEYDRLRQELARQRLAERSDRVRTLVLNLERWRWLPDDLGTTHLVVNIPAYELIAREYDADIMYMRAVVGRTSARTPVLSDTLRSITFNPTWAVPRSLIASETMPRVRQQGVDYLIENRYTVYRGDVVIDPRDVEWSRARVSDYGFIQGPGPTNPMGEVKFNLGNPYNIFLHDTNQRRLLTSDSRTFSAGCVRLESALELAEWMLRHWSNWQPEDIQEHLGRARPEYVAPRDRWDVHLVYFTAWPRPGGTVDYFDDVYGHDRRLAAALGI